LVLFMDSEEKSFFDDPAVLKTVYSACKGFVRDLDEMKTENEVRFVTTDWRGHVVAWSEQERARIARYESIASDGGVFDAFVQDLTFKSVTSVEMHLQGS